MKKILLTLLFTISAFSAEMKVVPNKHLTAKNFAWIYNPKIQKCEETKMFCDQKESIFDWTVKQNCSVYQDRAFGTGYIVDCLDQEKHVWAFAANERDCKVTTGYAKLAFKVYDAKFKKGDSTNVTK